MTHPPLSRQPVYKNESFKCKKCGTINPPAAASCRNHCTNCLYSRHVDLSAPGDRMSVCGGLMEPFSITRKSGKERQIVHHCLKCDKKEANIIAPDDNLETIIKIMRKQNTEFIPDQNEAQKNHRKRI